MYDYFKQWMVLTRKHCKLLLKINIARSLKIKKCKGEASKFFLEKIVHYSLTFSWKLPLIFLNVLRLI